VETGVGFGSLSKTSQSAAAAINLSLLAKRNPEMGQLSQTPPGASKVLPASNGPSHAHGLPRPAARPFAALSGLPRNLDLSALKRQVLTTAATVGLWLDSLRVA